MERRGTKGRENKKTSDKQNSFISDHNGYLQKEAEVLPTQRNKNAASYTYTKYKALGTKRRRESSTVLAFLTRGCFLFFVLECKTESSLEPWF